MAVSMKIIPPHPSADNMIFCYSFRVALLHVTLDTTNATTPAHVEKSTITAATAV